MLVELLMKYFNINWFTNKVNTYQEALYYKIYHRKSVYYH